MKSQRSRLAVAGTVLALSVTFAGCAQADPSAAARVGGSTVSENDVQTATRELSQLQVAQPLNADLVTQYLAFGPTIDQRLTQAGVRVGPEKAKTLLADPDTPLSAPSQQVLTTLSGLMVLSEAQQTLAQPGAKNAAEAQRVVAAGEQALEEMQQRSESGDIVINPKYQETPVNWIKQAAPAGLDGAPGQTGEGQQP